MDRKKALTLAGAAALSITTIGAAAAVNLGLLHGADDPSGGVGDLTVDTVGSLVPGAAPGVAGDQTPTTIYLDQYVVEEVPGGTPRSGDTFGGPVGAPATDLSPSTGATTGDDDGPLAGEPAEATDVDDDALAGDDAHEVEDDEHEDELDDHDDHEEHEEHEYEGADDDD